MDQSNGVKYTQVLAAGATTLGALALGTALGWSSPAVNELKDPQSYIPTSAVQGSWIGSLLSIGALIASLCAGVVIERIGRKPTMIYIAVPFIAGWLLITFAEYVWMLYIGRVSFTFCKSKNHGSFDVSPVAAADDDCDETPDGRLKSVVISVPVEKGRAEIKPDDHRDEEAGGSSSPSVRDAVRDLQTLRDVYTENVLIKLVSPGCSGSPVIDDIRARLSECQRRSVRTISHFLRNHPEIEVHRFLNDSSTKRSAIVTTTVEKSA